MTDEVESPPAAATVDTSIIYFMGGPSAGVSTQVDWITSKFAEESVGSITTSNLLHAATEDGSEIIQSTEGMDALDIAVLIRDKMKSGELIPDEIMYQLINQEIKNQNKKYLLISGFPKTLVQANNFKPEVGKLEAVIYLEVDDDELLKRVESGEASGLDKLKAKLSSFNDSTKPVVDKFKADGILEPVDGTRSINAVRADCMVALRKHWDLPVKTGEPEVVPPSNAANGKSGSKCCNLI